MKKILVVEDEPDIQELLGAYLRDTGYDVEIVGDGVAALDRFQKGTFDLILLDLMLPKIDGFGVCELIRRESDVPILMLTALDGEEEQLRGFGLDVDDYVTKPFSMPILLEKIRVILRRFDVVESDSRLHYRELVIDPDAREALLNGRPHGNLSCYTPLPPPPEECLPGKCCWPSCGVMTFTGMNGWWTATSKTYATSWGPATSKR